MAAANNGMFVEWIVMIYVTTFTSLNYMMNKKEKIEKV